MPARGALAAGRFRMGSRITMRMRRLVSRIKRIIDPSETKEDEDGGNFDDARVGHARA